MEYLCEEGVDLGTFGVGKPVPVGNFPVQAPNRAEPNVESQTLIRVVVGSHFL